MIVVVVILLVYSYYCIYMMMDDGILSVKHFQVEIRRRPSVRLSVLAFDFFIVHVMTA